MNKEEQTKIMTQLLKDLKLLSDTSRILAQKMENVQINTIKLLTSLGVETGELPTTQVKESPKPAPTTDDFKSRMTTESVTEILSSFSSFVQKANDTAAVAARLEKMRDRIIPLYSGGFHPAFAEMGRTAREVKGMKTMDDAKKMLQEKIIDWRSRLAK
ncbi:MAG: hypothetical protein ACTSP4_04475 [Candidatus Hodarchaeales archaeon]